MLTLLALVAHAAPIEITWQARLLDATGAPLVGTRTLDVALHDAADDPSATVWSDTFTVTSQDGFVSLALGSGSNPLDTSDLAAGDRWLSIAIGGQDLGARQRLTHVPRAVVAEAVPVVASPSAASCAGQPGRLAWDSTASALKVCDGADWRTIGFGVGIVSSNGARAWADGTYARSCKAYLEPTGAHLYQGATGSGRYWIDPDAGGPIAAFQVECDMENHGGGWTRLAHIQSAVADASATRYTNGLNSLGATDHIAPCGPFESIAAQPVVRLRMGSVVDFFRPSGTNSLCQMLTSNSRHQWSASPTGTFVTPGYYGSHLGGSSVNWPQSNVSGDNRRYLSFWGGGGSANSGCCATVLSDNAGDWGRTFDIYVRE